MPAMLAAVLRPARHWLGIAELEQAHRRETERLRASLTLERGRGNELEVEVEGLDRRVSVLEDRVAELDPRYRPHAARGDRCHAIPVERT